MAQSNNFDDDSYSHHKAPKFKERRPEYERYESKKKTKPWRKKRVKKK